MRTEQIEFHGRMLKRGFWIYVWTISFRQKKYFYVGRTGDNSSPNAASPFNRLSMHLDMRDNATANCIVRRMREKGVDPTACKYKMLAIGPLFEEQDDFESHRPYRDRVARIEAELAYYLTERGCDVVGVHPRRGEYDMRLFNRIKRHVGEKVLRNI